VNARELVLRYVPLEQATALPGNGHCDVMVNRWWCYQPDRGLMFFGKSPQCNTDERLARSIQQRCWPDAELLFVERVYLPHDCGDYV